MCEEEPIGVVTGDGFGFGRRNKFVRIS